MAKRSIMNHPWVRLILSLFFAGLSFAFPTDFATQIGLAGFFGACALLFIVQMFIQRRNCHISRLLAKSEKR
ncbi:hypothetical protein [Celerinatantimonas yamalensis]|uniref:Uncharacterized protein n=1 Tax=Celerinatantimonas yamalensis TaxID=559956 RepID=A0ABW9G820_9GAMM